MRKTIGKLRRVSWNVMVALFRKTREDRIRLYISKGRHPWSTGYTEYKQDFIAKALESNELLADMTNKILPKKFGVGLDERVVEYPWIFSKLNKKEELLLDAGSTFNFDFIVRNIKLKNKNLTIYTYHPERNCFFDLSISYVFGDLRKMYFQNNTFDLVISQSTIEHIDMDNSIYGYNVGHTVNRKSYEYLKAIDEFIRVLRKNGTLLLTFPYGIYENHDFFQQFDSEMLNQLTLLLNRFGTFEIDFFKYERDGWRFAALEELSAVKSYNPHTGKGKLDDGAAHCRSVACIEFHKNK